MKKVLGFLLSFIACVGMVLAGPIVQIPLVSNANPIYQSEKFQPLIFRNANVGGRVLFDDPYGFYANGNIVTRNQNYAFTGEGIQWRFLVWDKNGVPEKIKEVFAGWATQSNGPIDPNNEVNCQYVTGTTAPNGQPPYCVNGGSLAECGYPNVRRPGDQEPQTTFNSATMGEYVCTLTIKAGCYGQVWVGAKVIDIDNLSSTVSEAESWFCNPRLSFEVSGDINFGTLGPGQQGSATFSVKNTGEGGVMTILAISGKDFYDPSSGGGKCPTSNVLRLQGDCPAGGTSCSHTHGFWYTATKGSMTTGIKRIPYAVDITQTDPIFSSSTQALQWRRWAPPAGSPSLLSQALSPGTAATITLYLGLPIPCNGQFTDGQINLWAWAI